MVEAIAEAPVAFGDLNPDTVPLMPRAVPRRLDPAVRLRGFLEVSRGLGTSRAFRAATRCLHCGACTACDLCWAFCPDAAIVREAAGAGGPARFRVDLEHCKGCGICAVECPRGAIALEGVR